MNKSTRSKSKQNVSILYYKTLEHYKIYKSLMLVEKGVSPKMAKTT